MLTRELRFLRSLWAANLQGNMEYRGAFIWQVVGMMLNNAFYFVFWVIFFQEFEQVRGWELSDMLILFGIVASSFGLVSLLFGNAFNLGETIARGRLDYYLSLPRPVLLHAVASRSIPSGLGDFAYGILSYLAAGAFSWDSFARFLVSVILAASVFVSFMVIAQSLTFWIGNSTALGTLMVNAILTFALYPASLFDGPAKFVLLTIIPAAFVGAIPAGFTLTFTWESLLQMLLGAAIFLALAIAIFRLGLRRYESGSAIQVEV